MAKEIRYGGEARQAITKGILQVCDELEITVIAEGIETYEELAVLRSFGIELFQGFYFAQPSFQSLCGLPGIHFPTRVPEPKT